MLGFIIFKKNGGDGEIRTRGTQNARTLSKGLVSATHPRLRIFAEIHLFNSKI